MSVFLVSVFFDTHLFDYSTFNRMLANIEAEQVMPGTWVCDTDSPIGVITAEVERALGEHDKFLIAEIGRHWIGGRIDRRTANWLKARRP